MRTSVEDVKIVGELQKNSTNGTTLLFDKYYEVIKSYLTNHFKDDFNEAEEISLDTLIKKYKRVWMHFLTAAGAAEREKFAKTYIRK
jgi:hypothetical protein